MNNKEVVDLLKMKLGFSHKLIFPYYIRYNSGLTSIIEKPYASIFLFFIIIFFAEVPGDDSVFDRP